MADNNAFMTVPLYHVVNLRSDGEGGWECGTSTTLRANGNSECGATVAGYLYAGSSDRPRHRVTHRTLSDGRGWSATTNYKYWDPSAVPLPYDESHKEFRGHAKVRVIDPIGTYTDTWFHQDDQKKGRAYSTETRSSTGALYTKTDSTFSASNPFTGVTFVKLDRTDNYECEGTTHCHQMAETFLYDSYGNLTQKNNLGDVLLSGDERTEVTQWAVNIAKWIHRPIRTEFYGAANNLLRERWMSYDNAAYGTIGDRGLLTEEESRLNGSRGHPDNPKVLHSYDVWGNKETVTDPLGCTTTTLYHAQKDVPTRVTNCLGHQTNMDYYPTTRQLLYRRDANDQYTWFTYDTLGREITMTGPLDGGSYFGTQTTGYLDWGNPNAQRTHRERTTEHGTANSLWSDERFDGLGRAYQTTQEGPDSTKAIVTSYKTFDARGLVAASAAPFFVYYSGGSDTAVWTTSQYDPLARPTLTTFPNGTTAQKVYEHHLVTEIDPKGNIKKTFMDSHHRVSAIEEHNGSQVYSTDYDYDDANSLVKVTNHLQHKTRMAYDLLGRKIRMCDPNMGSQPSGDDCADNTQGVWKYEYDKAGKLTKQTDAKGQVLVFEYDLLGRQKFKRRDSATGTVLVTWNYDTAKITPPPSGADYPLGRLTEIIDAKIKTQFAYDKVGRVLQTRRQYTGSTTWHAMTQSYDALGRVTSETFPDADTVSYTYNTAGWLGAVNASSGTNYVNTITYNARGQKKSVTYGNNVVTSFSYNDPQDLPGQSSQWNLRNNNRTTSGNRQNLSYGYDANGNVTSITDAIYSYNRTFHYDGLNRLVGPNSGCPDPFDAIGRVWKMDCGAVDHYYNNTLHPAAVTGTSQGKTYEYNDANGNMTRRNGVDITWDIDNRVTSIGSVLMEYDYSGRRIKKTNGTSVTLYPFKGYEISPAGTITKYIMVGTEIYASKIGGTKFFYHNDHLGGVNIITDSFGNIGQRTEYSIWGGVSYTSGAIDTTHRFTGQEFDAETGLYYYGGRYYDAETGRFISPDPFIQEPQNPQNLNRYTYVLNNPQNLIDPTGFHHEKKKPSIGRIIGGVIASIVVGWATAGAGVAPVLAGAMAGFTAGAVSVAGTSGVNPVSALFGGAFLGGVAGAISPAIFSGLGGVSGAGFTAGNFAAAVGAGAVTGAVSGALSTGIFGGSFGRNVGFGALGGAGSAALFFGLGLGWEMLQGSVPYVGITADSCVGGCGLSLQGGTFQNISDEGPLNAIVGELIRNAGTLTITGTAASHWAERWWYYGDTALKQAIMAASTPQVLPSGRLAWNQLATHLGRVGMYELVVNPRTMEIGHFLFTTDRGRIAERLGVILSK